MEFDEDFVVKEKFMKVYKNGDPMMKPIEIKIQKGLTLNKIANTLEQKTDMKNIREIRLFNQEGVELYDDDLLYLKDKAIVYASKGEDFDANSSFSEYNLVKVLGEGGFGQVQLGLHKITQEKVAIKIVKTNIIGNASDIDMVFREAEILKSLNHKNIVKIKNCYTLSDMKVVFIMEYLEGGELLDRVDKVGHFTEEQAKVYFKQIVDAMNYCHKNKLIHRDLKLENLLLVSENSDQIKVVDFGIAGVASKQSVENIDAGSLRYMAPEVLNGKTKQITPAIDVWAMGVILYMMIVGEFPFNGPNNNIIMEKITEGVYEIPKDIKKKLSKECLDVIEKTLQVDPTNRISTVDLMNHPFISETNITIKFIEEENKSQAGSDNASTKQPSKVNTPVEKPVIQKTNSAIVGTKNVISQSNSGSGSTKSGTAKKPAVSTNPKGSLTPQAGQVKKPVDNKSGFSSAVSSRFSKK
ncbi:hypothetical protein ABPG74_012891 [Tetrahymena malaccensis]